jgi:hypothetical protein
MYTSMLLFVLAVPGAGDAPTWVTDYAAARKQGATASKPLAVFLGSGKAGYQQVIRGGELNPNSNRMLAANYVPVYIDTSTEAGQRLARDFEMPGGRGLVISDRTGQLQAFRHQGELTDQDLAAYLQRYADGNRLVATTETATGSRASFYAGPGNMSAPAGLIQNAIPGAPGLGMRYPVGGYGGLVGGYAGGYAGGSQGGYYGGYMGGSGGCGSGGCGSGGCGSGGCGSGGGRGRRCR